MAMSVSSTKSTVVQTFSFEGDPMPDRMNQLDHYFHFVKQHLLSKQSGTLGLFMKGGDSSPIAPVRDNVYIATSLWCMSIAYKSLGNDHGRGYEMQQTAVKCMRAILICYMNNANKVEKFKDTHRNEDSLPANFHYESGDAIDDPDSAGHLQIDAVALFLLQLAQMTLSGLQLIFSRYEVHFVQNLVYYIERAYRTPDYGMWQQGGNKESLELHASSIGLAKAALESMNGLNLYGKDGNTLTTTHIDPDALHRNTSILSSLLPRESNSKETDSSLLPVVGYPAYAIDNKQLAEKTHERVNSKLKGSYGFRRFSRDGKYTALERTTERRQDPASTRVYEGIECEWPFFLTFIAIEKYCRGDKAGSRKVMDDLDRLLDKDGVVPRCYVVDEHHVQTTKTALGRSYCQPLQEAQPWLWGQSMYLISCLLTCGLVDISSMDPLGRHRSTPMVYPMRQDGCGIVEKNTVVQISLIAESNQLQTRLATFGIATQTVLQVEPIFVLQQSSLVEVFKELGADMKLGLSGRPSRPRGTLGTSMVYQIKGDAMVFTPLFLDQTDFYMSLDMHLLIDVIKDSLRFIHTNWKKPKRPLMVLLLRANHVWGKHFQELLEMISAFKQGNWDGVPVKLGRLQQFMATSFVEHLDFVQQDVRKLDERLITPTPSHPTSMHHRVSRHSLYNPVRMLSGQRSPPPPPAEPEEEIDYDKLYDTDDIMEYYEGTTVLSTRLMLLSRLFLCHGPGFDTPIGPVLDVVKALYSQAINDEDWYSIRIGASLLSKTVDSLAPSITLMVAVNRQVCLGVFGHAEHVISEPLPPAAIQTVLFNSVRPHKVADASLQQELVIFLGNCVTNQPELFEGMQRIRLGWLIQAMSDELNMTGNESVSIYQLAPSAIKQLLVAVLSSRSQKAERTCMQQRRREGSLNRVPAQFYERVLQVLLHCQGGLSLHSHTLPQEPLVQDNKPQDKSFILCVEELLSQSRSPEYRQLIVELLGVLASFFQRNSEVVVKVTVSLDKLLTDAVTLFATENHLDVENMSTDALATDFAKAYPYGNHGTASFMLRAAGYYLLHSQDCDISRCIVN